MPAAGKRPWLAALLEPLSPPVRTLRTYRLADLPHDLIAGLTVSVVDLPQSMAFAIIAGVPPVYGLYTAIVLAALGALFTSSRFLSVGPTNTQSLLVAAIVTRVWSVPDAHYVALVVALALVKGLIQLTFAAAKMGRLVRYVSGSVMVGFTSGAGVLIIVEQAPAFLGFSVEGSPKTLPGVVGSVARWIPHLCQIDTRSVGIGVGSLVLVLGLRRWSKHAPGPLLAVVGGGVLVWAMHWVGSDLLLVDPLPRGLPHFEVPHIGFGTGPAHVAWTEVEALLGGAFALAVLGMLESVSIAKSIAARTGQRIDANQEFFGQGFANVVGAFFLCIPGSGSFSRTALQYEVGARTRVASIFCAGFNAVFFLVLAPLARFIPLAALAAVLFVVATGLIDGRAIGRLRRTSRADFTVAAVTFAAALLVPLTYSIYVGIFASLALYLRQAGRLRVLELVPSADGAFVERPIDLGSEARDVLVLQLGGDLFFGVADELAEELGRVVEGRARVVVVRLKRTHHIDATVLAVFERFVVQMRERGRHVLFCGVHPDAKRRLAGHGLLAQLGDENVFYASAGVFDGMRAALSRASTLVGDLDLAAAAVKLGPAATHPGAGAPGVEDAVPAETDDGDDDDDASWSYQN